MKGTSCSKLASLLVIAADSSYYVMEHVQWMRAVAVVEAFCHGSSSYEGELPQISMLLHD
jgi:hypothetical protein